MLHHKSPALQVLRDGQWHYVFCHNTGRIVTTADRRKALSAKLDLQWFANKFGNDTFRAEPTGAELLAAVESLKRGCAGRAPTDAEWKELFALESQLRPLGLLQSATYNVD